MVRIEDVKHIGNIEFLAKKAVEGFITGFHKSPYNGFSVEFADHKQYGYGDSIKTIDWKVYSRTNKLFIKRFEEETNLRCHILIDSSSSMLFPIETKGKLSFSLLAAAALCQLLQRQRDAFGTYLFDEKIKLKTEIKSTKTHLKNIFNILNAELNSSHTHSHTSGTNIATTITQIATTIHKRSLVIIFSDLLYNNDSLEEILQSLRYLKHGKHEVIIFNTLDETKEELLELENRPYEFIDLETNEKVKLNPEQIKGSYASQMEKFKKEIELKCAQYKIDFVNVDINQGVYPVLSSFLVKRKKMR